MNKNKGAVSTVDSTFIDVSFRGHTRDRAKYVVEIAYALKSTLKGNVGDLLVGGLKKAYGAIDSVFVHKTRKIDLVSLAEHSREIMVFISQLLGYRGEGQWLGKVLRDVVEDMADKIVVSTLPRVQCHRGEPLMQADFLLEALTLLRGKTSRALQTCGYCEEDVFARVLSECDLVLYDLKLIDPERHKRYTGVSNEAILENYRTLVRSGVEFVTRIPLIPSVNDTEENITATASFMKELGVRYIELLPYNKMAGGKYPSLGRSYRVDFPCEAEPSPRLDIFERHGIEVKIL